MIALSVDVEPDFPPHLNTNRGIEGLKVICEMLRKYDAGATMFVCTDFLKNNPCIMDLVSGFEVGCHGLRHVDLTELSESRLESEILEALRIFREYGIEPSGFRAPYARVNSVVLKVIGKYFKYDSSLHFYNRRAEQVREIPLFIGGKTFGISPHLFRPMLKFPLKNKVFFIHPWEYGGLDFHDILERRKNLRPLGYCQKNYFKNLEFLLKMKPLDLSGLS